jgi:hypothetical protein
MTSLEPTEVTTSPSPSDEAASPAVAPEPAVSASPSKDPVPAPGPSGASLGKNVILFLGIMTTLALGYSYLGKEVPAPAIPAVRWAAGQTVDVEVTLVAADAKNLGCASPTEIAGRHCAFEGPGKPWTKGTPGDDLTTLRPYTTTNRIQFLASGLWSQPSLAAEKLPPTRFTVKCKYTVEGKIRSPQVRWDEAGAWNPQTNEWYTGRLSTCSVAP